MFDESSQYLRGQLLPNESQIEFIMTWLRPSTALNATYVSGVSLYSLTPESFNLDGRRIIFPPEYHIGEVRYAARRLVTPLPKQIKNVHIRLTYSHILRFEVYGYQAKPNIGTHLTLGDMHDVTRVIKRDSK